jgi:hypothetical protein
MLGIQTGGVYHPSSEGTEPQTKSTSAAANVRPTAIGTPDAESSLRSLLRQILVPFPIKQNSVRRLNGGPPSLSRQHGEPSIPYRVKL